MTINETPVTHGEAYQIYTEIVDEWHDKFGQLELNQMTETELQENFLLRELLDRVEPYAWYV